ncbi:MAG: hypothetical protein IT423_15005, partial [Pirellulaceae bacterium]|nr:hypothetical protein [Pirellulaceae bacterium]
RGAALQISINEDLRQIRETLNQASGPTAARDTVSALSDLVNAQNLFVGVWVNYEALRRNLDLDLGTMQIDSEGLWIDPGPIRSDTVGGAMGPAILNYGLTEDEAKLQQRMATSTSDAPLEVRTSQPVRLDDASGAQPIVMPAMPMQAGLPQVIKPGMPSDFQSSFNTDRQPGMPSPQPPMPPQPPLPLYSPAAQQVPALGAQAIMQPVSFQTPVAQPTGLQVLVPPGATFQR